MISFMIIAAVTTDRRLRSINTLTTTASAIAEGDLNRVAPVEHNDEIGTLAIAFNSMTQQLRELLENLEQQVTDRTQALETEVAQLRAQLERLQGEAEERTGKKTSCPSR